MTTNTIELLVLGGTGWLGGEVTRTALARGYQVTCAARGQTGSAPEGAHLVLLDRDVNTSLPARVRRRWDAVIDVSSQPGQVLRASQLLREVSQHFVYVSSASVYDDHATPGADESAATLCALDRDTWTDIRDYGCAKVACENHVRAAFGADRCTIARVGLIGGPGDHTYRTGYWPHRFAKAEQAQRQVLIPDTPDLSVQIIDVRDLAAWLVHCAAQRLAGTMNAVGRATRLGDVLQAAQQVAGYSGQTHAASEAWLIAQGVSPWAGPKSLPLWVPGATHVGFGGRSSAKAEAAGLQRRPLVDTLRDTLHWEQSRPEPALRKAGLSDLEEAALLAQFLQCKDA